MKPPSERDIDPYGFDDRPRSRCTMRGCRKVLSEREAQIMVCDEHALRCWQHIQLYKGAPDIIEAAVKLYETKLDNEARMDESKRVRMNPTNKDRRAAFEWLNEGAPPITAERQAFLDSCDWVEEDIYFIRQGELIKIGYSTDLEARLRSYGPTITVLAHHPGTRADERDLHRSFRPLLAHGREWYNPGQVLLDHIAQVVKVHGEPFCVPEWSKPRGPVVGSTKASLTGHSGHM